MFKHFDARIMNVDLSVWKGIEDFFINFDVFVERVVIVIAKFHQRIFNSFVITTKVIDPTVEPFSHHEKNAQFRYSSELWVRLL